MAENLVPISSWTEWGGGTGVYLWIEGSTLKLGPDYQHERDIFAYGNRYGGVIPVNGGDRVVFSFNVRLDPSGSGDGAQIGYDYYDANQRGIQDPNSPWFFGENAGKIPWGGSGQLKIDKVVPAYLNGIAVKYIVPWAMAQPFTDPNFVYFTVPELYINPNGGDGGGATYVGFRSNSIYPQSYATVQPVAYWEYVAKTFASYMPTATPVGQEIIGKAGVITFNQAVDDRLTYYDTHGIYVYLQVGDEPYPPYTVPQLMDLCLQKYGSHPCVLGWGIDVELRGATWTEYVPVTDAEATAWLNQLRGYNPNFKLFLKHWDQGIMPPTVRVGIIFLDDSQGFTNLSGMVAEFQAWANAFAGADGVGFGVGYPDDRPWWSALANPPRDIAQAIFTNVPNAKWVYWVNVGDTVTEVFPPLLQQTYQFDHWTINGVTYTQNPLSIVGSEGAVFDVEAAYMPKVGTHLLTIAATQGGTTNPSVGIYEIPEGQVQQVRATPDSGYRFLNWWLDGVGRTENPISVTMNADHVLSASFEYIPPPPTTATINGVVRDARTGTVLVGAIVTCDGLADVTEINGSYAFIDIEAKTYTVTASMGGYTSKSVTLTLSANSIVTLDFDLVPVSPPGVLPLWGLGALGVVLGIGMVSAGTSK